AKCERGQGRARSRRRRRRPRERARGALRRVPHRALQPERRVRRGRQAALGPRAKPHPDAREVMKRAALALVLLVTPAAAEDREALANSGVAALRAGRPGDAIETFEALADRGVIDPNMSLDRGLAYALRVKLGSDLPGDLGRAAHGFEEAKDLAGNDPTLAE